MDENLGVAVIDRFTNLMMEFFERHVTPQSTMADMFKYLGPGRAGESPRPTEPICSRGIQRRYNYVFPIRCRSSFSDFFGNVQEVRPTENMPENTMTDAPVYIPVEGKAQPGTPQKSLQSQRPFYDLMTFAAFRVPAMFYVRIGVMGICLAALYKF